jgi:hypothetical protein
MRNLTIAVAVSVLSLMLARQAKAATAFFNFDPPAVAQGPSEFLNAGNMQTIPFSGVATFTGGVVLGTETNLPALSFGTVPNVYGTALNTFIDSSFVLPDQITITINPSFTVNEISFPLFNGFTSVESYTVDAFNGTTQIGQQVLSNLPANTDSGHGVIDLKAPDITSVTVSPNDTSSWDFSIDSVAFNEAVSAAINPNGTPITSNTGGSGVVPLPPAAWSALAMLAALGLCSVVRSWRADAGI